MGPGKSSGEQGQRAKDLMVETGGGASIVIFHLQVHNAVFSNRFHYTDHQFIGNTLQFWIKKELGMYLF